MLFVRGGSWICMWGERGMLFVVLGGRRGDVRSGSF